MPQVHANEAIRLTDHLDPQGVQITGLQCRSCHVYGPAVLAFDTATSTNINPTWDTAGAGVEAIIWEIDPVVRPQFLGAVELVDCHFEDCTFSFIGLVMTPTGAHNFASGLRIR